MSEQFSFYVRDYYRDVYDENKIFVIVKALHENYNRFFYFYCIGNDRDVANKIKKYYSKNWKKRSKYIFYYNILIDGNLSNAGLTIEFHRQRNAILNNKRISKNIFPFNCSIKEIRYVEKRIT